MCQEIRTGDPWSQQEQCLLINVLELTPALLAVQTFAKDSPKTQIHIHLRMDNVSALTYVSRMGDSFSKLDEGSLCTLGLVSPKGNDFVSIPPAAAAAAAAAVAAPLHHWEWPERSWVRLYIGYAGPCSGKYFLFLID